MLLRASIVSIVMAMPCLFLEDIKVNKQEFLEMLHHEIPLTQTMGIQVKEFTNDLLCLSAPISLNSNHKDTFFGGSLYTVAVTAGWGMMHLKMTELGYSGHVVIHEGTIKYLQPVSKDVVARCTMNQIQIQRMEKQLRRRSRAVMSLDVVLGEDDKDERVLFSGRYAVV